MIRSKIFFCIDDIDVEIRLAKWSKLALVDDAALQLVEHWLLKWLEAVTFKVVQECHTEYGLIRTLNQAKDWL